LAGGPACDEATLGPDEKVLVFSETTAFRHAPIPSAAICDSPVRYVLDVELYRPGS
jgi:hypothetical protein